MSTLIESLENRQLFVATTGHPDASFASGGVATVSFRSDLSGDSATPITVLTDSGGRSYVVAQTKASVQVKRVDAFGVVDSTYSSARGLLGLPFDASSETISPVNNFKVDGVSAALDSADRLLILTGTKLYRFTVSGKIDRTFGTNGVADLSGTFSGAAAIDVDASNRVYVVGSIAYFHDSNNHPLYVMRTARLRSNGALDKTFATNGLFTSPQPGTDGDHYTGGTSIGQMIRVADDGSVTAAAVATYSVGSFGGVTPLLPYARGVQTTRFTSAGQPDAAYGAHASTQQYQASTDVDYRGITLVGIRSNGTVVTDKYTRSSDSGAKSDQNLLTGTDGNTGHSYFLNAGESDTIDLIGDAQFVGLPDGSEYVVDQLHSSLYKHKADATLDRTFTGNGSTAPIAAVTDVALPGDGTLITLNKASKALALNVGRIFGSNTPVANLASKPLNAPGPLIFNVVYKSAAGFATHGTIDGSEITVNTKNQTGVHPTVLQTTTLPGNVLNVRYRLTDTDGSFGFADNGQYLVSLVGGKVTDSAGNVAAAQELGDVVVAI